MTLEHIHANTKGRVYGIPRIIKHRGVEATERDTQTISGEKLIFAWLCPISNVLIVLIRLIDSADNQYARFSI